MPKPLKSPNQPIAHEANGLYDTEPSQESSSANAVDSASEEKPSAAMVKSSARTLDILELVADHLDGLTFIDIHHCLNIPVSSLHGLLATMVHRAYLTRDEASGLYRLGPKLLSLASAYQGDVDLTALADSAMDQLRRKTRETTSLTVLQHDIIVFIHKRATEGTVQVVNPVGTVLPAHATGSGKVMLAYLTERELMRIYPQEQLKPRTPNTITSRAALLQELAQVREQGYAYDDQESEVGVWAVASCIRNAQGRPVAAISVVAPVFRVQNQDCTEWPRYVMESAAQVSAALGFGI